MSKIRTFKVNGEVYDIPDTEVSSFLKDMPKAQEVQSFIVDKDTFDIPLTEVESFKKDMPTAKLTFEDKSEPSIGESMLVESAQKPFGAPEPTIPDNIDFASAKKPSATKTEPNIDFKAAEVVDSPKLKTQDKQALNTVMPTMPLNVLTNRKSREVFYNTYASKQKLNVADVREYGERVTAQRVLQLAQDALSQGDLESAESLANSQLKTRSKDAKAIIANIAIQYDKKGDKENAERLYAPLAQVGTGSYKQPSYTPTTLGFSGKQGATTESNGEIIPDTQETEQSKYMKGIAETLEKMTPGHAQVGMIESGLGKIVKAGEQANPNQMGDAKNLSALLNLGVGLGETALGAVLAGTPSGAANFQPFEVATNYLPEDVSGWLMPVSHAISKYYDGKPSEDAQNVGFVLDTALFMLLHKGYNAAKKGIEVKNLLQFDDKEVAQAVKASEERLKQYGGNTTEYREAVMNDNTATIDQMKEASHVAEGLDAHANTTDYQPIPHPESLGTIPEGYDVEYQGRQGIIDRGDDGTWYFNDNETGKSEQILVKDKFNPQETLNDLGIQILPEVPQEQVAKAMADAERIGWVEEKGKRYFVALGNPKIEGSFDMVFKQTADGRLVNRFDSHPDPTFGQNRKLKIANKLLEQEGLPKRESLRAPIQSEPTSVVESAVTEPVSEAKAVQETPSVEAAEGVQEPAAVESAEITPTEDAIQVDSPEKLLQPTQERVRSEDLKEMADKQAPSGKAAKQELGEIKKATKELADFLRKGKINRPDSFAANTPGSIVWDVAIEIAAKTIEAGGDVAQAVADAIKHLKESDWYKGLEQSRKVKAEQDLTSYIKQEHQEQFPLGIKNASSRAENAYLGIEPNTELTAEQKRDVKTVQHNAKRYVEQGGDPEVLINKTIQERSQLNAEELSVILDHKIKLGNDIKSLSDKLIDAYANGDSSAPAMEEKLQDLTNRFEKANEALEISGYEQGLAFRMRQIMKNNDYSLAESERKWRVASQGKEMPIEVREKFAEIENKLNESQKRLDALEKANQRLKSERAVQNIEAKVGKAGDKLRALAAKIESGRVSKLQGFRSSSGFDLAWDASLKVIAESLKGGAELADAIEKGLAYIRNTDWYKNLQDKKDFEQKYEDHLNKEYSKAEYESAHYDDKGKLRISKELIKDIVRDGVENPDDLAKKVHDIIKEDLPDVSERKVKEAITEYGKTINQSKDALEAEVRRLKREGRLELGLEDAEQGKGVKRSGLLREKPTDRERELKRKINEELKKHPEDQADIYRKWKSALDRIKTGLENSIRDITKRIDDIQNGVAEPKVEKKAIPLDAEAEVLKKQKKALQEQLTELEGEQGMSDEQRINLAMNNAKKAMEEYQRRIDEINSTGGYTEKAKRPMPESPELDALNAEKERLKQEYENALENHGIDKIRATEQALKRKQQQIDAIVNKINSKGLGFLKKKLSKVDPNNPELKLANTQLEQAKAMLNKLREEEGLINQRKLELYRKRIADRTTALEQEIASLKNGTWKEKVKPEELSLDRDILVERAKMDAIKFDRDKLIEEERLKNRSWKEKVYEVIQDVMNIPKSILSSADLSAPLRQGFVLGASHPILAMGASKEMIKHMMSEKVHEQWMHEFRQTPEYRVAKDAGLYLTEPNAKLSAKEENFISNLIHKAWGIGKIVKGSERAYTAYLNKLRVDVFGDFVDAINQTDMTPTEKKENLKAYADFVNNASGRGKLGAAGESAAPLLNATFFAPRYVASRFNLLARALTGFQGMPPAARLRAIKDFGIYLGVVSTSLALAKAAGAEVETDPRSSDFGKIKVGNTRYDMLAGFQQPMVFMSRMISNQTKNGAGEIVELGEKYNSKTRADIAVKFLRSKASPQAGVIYDSWVGRFYDGSKFNWKDATLNSVTPLIEQDMAKMYKTEGAKGIAKTAPSIFGIGVQQQPEIMNIVLALYPVKPNIQEKLDKIKYSPDNYSDNTLYKGTEEFKITPEQVAQIADLRAKYASEAIDKAWKGEYILKISKTDTEPYSKLSKMDDISLKIELNSIYNLATQKAKNIVLGEDNWNEKIVED